MKTQDLVAAAIAAAHRKKQIAQLIARVLIATQARPPIRAIATAIGIQAREGRVPRFKISPAYRGGPLKVERYAFPIVVDLKGLSVNQQSVIANLDHDGTKRVGHVDHVENDGRQLSLSGPVSAAGPAADEFLGSKKNNFPWQASIEALPLQKPELIPAGKTVFVNGRNFRGPLLVARRAELFGVSFVPRGADDGTSVSIAARRRKKAAVA